ncbi:MAG: flagellar basal body rod protein FlgC [Pyrinomonadaceae bacterium]|nr:flagellar basal body rod protein FlgC [Pyrinomonadaceae bacterium]
MSVFTIFKIASEGMTAQRERLEAAAANLANANSTRSSDGTIYRRRDVVMNATEISESWRSNAEKKGIFADESAAVGVSTEVKLADEDQYIQTYKPGHPDADENGYVKMPNVQPLEETVNMMSAARSFEANATVFNTAKELARVSISLGDA